jgi:hypothetical protein
MRRNVPRLASCGFLAVSLLLLPSPVLAQHVIGGCGGGSTPCPNRDEYFDEANPDPVKGCGALESGSTYATYSADGVYETVYNSAGSTCTPKAFFEWIWVFDNVPAGNRYLTFKGHSDSNNWQLYYRSCPGGKTCPADQQPCPTDGYIGLKAINGMIGPGPGDSGGTISIGSNSVASTVCILMQLCKDPDCPVDNPQADVVHIDLLKVSTNLANNCASLH